VQSKAGASIYHVEGGAAKLSKLLLSASGTGVALLRRGTTTKDPPMKSQNGASTYHVVSGATKLSKLPLSTSDILGLYYCAKGQPESPPNAI
jgi:hypothetical protein